MVAHRLFVIWIHPIFLEAVRLILNLPTIEWVGSTSDYKAARDQLAILQPDAVLMEVEEIEKGDHIPALEILKDSNWDIRVIGLSPTDNSLYMYHHEHRILGQVEDLIHLIQGSQ